MTQLATSATEVPRENSQAYTHTSEMLNRVQGHNTRISALIDTVARIADTLHGPSQESEPATTDDPPVVDASLSHLSFALTEQDRLIDKLVARIQRI